MLNHFLTPSQKQLLPVLVGAGRPLSILDLSNLAEMPYATTYTVLESLRKTNLLVSTRSGRKVFFELNNKNEDAQTLLQLFTRNHLEHNQSKFHLLTGVTDEEVLLNLADLGAPLVLENKKQKNLSPEETVAMALGVARKNPTSARTLPVVLAQNFNSLNYPRLRFLVKELGETRALGFFLDLTGTLKGNLHLKKLANELLDQRVKQSEPFFKTFSSKFESMLANRKTPKLARKWHFTMNMDMNDFRSFFEKHYDGTKTV